MSEPATPAAASRPPDRAPRKPQSRWGFLRCLATWMPGGGGGMSATGTQIWSHLRDRHD